MKPRWPKLKRDYTGRKVRLTRSLRNCANGLMKKGRVAVVVSYYRGLILRAVRKPSFYVTRVELSDVELLKKS